MEKATAKVPPAESTPSTEPLSTGLPKAVIGIISGATDLSNTLLSYQLFLPLDTKQFHSTVTRLIVKSCVAFI